MVDSCNLFDISSSLHSLIINSHNFFFSCSPPYLMFFVIIPLTPGLLFVSVLIFFLLCLLTVIEQLTTVLLARISFSCAIKFPCVSLTKYVSVFRPVCLIFLIQIQWHILFSKKEGLCEDNLLSPLLAEIIMTHFLIRHSYFSRTNTLPSSVSWWHTTHMDGNGYQLSQLSNLHYINAINLAETGSVNSCIINYEGY